MIDVKQATKIASDHFNNFYGDEPFVRVLLEEVDFDEEKHAWLITIGYTDPKEEEEIGDFLSTMKQRMQRRYKIFEIDAETGEMRSMKVRSVEHA